MLESPFRRLAWCLGAVALGAALACGSGTDSEASTVLRVAVIPKGTTHEFWKSIHAGALKAASELDDVEVVFRGPQKEDDRDQQISLVQDFVSRRVGAIVLAPLDDRALLAPVRMATQRGIPVVVIDSGLAGEVGTDFASYVATDNQLGGALAGRHMGELLGGTGRVLLLRYAEGSESTAQREAGFVQALAAFDGIELVDPQRYAGATVATAQQASENLLSVHADVDGIFCPNETSTFGMLLALRSRGLAGQRRFVGFDASQALVAGLAAGEIDGLVVQNPMRMGELGVKTAVAAARGEPVEGRIDTGVSVATQANMSEPDMAALLAPDLARWLDG